MGPKIQKATQKFTIEKHVRPQSVFCDLEKTSHLYRVICAQDVREELQELLSNWNGDVWTRHQLNVVWQNTSEKMDQIDENLKARIRDICAEEYEFLQKIDILE